MNSSNKTRYSDEELQDFRKVIIEKLENARAEFRYHQEQLMHANENGTDDTSNSYVTLEEGSLTLEKNSIRSRPLVSANSSITSKTL